MAKYLTLEGLTQYHTGIKGIFTEQESVKEALDSKAPLASPQLSGVPTAPTPEAGTNTVQIATTEFVKTAVDSVLAASDAMIFKGTLGSGGTIAALPALHKAGDTYKVITAGSYAGVSCEAGDMIICIAGGTANNNGHWTVVQSNLDGAVIGPAGAVSDNLVSFNGTAGRLIQDSGKKVVAVIDTTENVPTANAVKTFIEEKGYVPFSEVVGITSEEIDAILAI